MAPPPTTSGVRLLVLYASQTGNAVEAAGRVCREGKRGGCPAVHVLSMDSFDPSRLPGERVVVFVVSTAGQGDPPDSMKVGFWRYLLKKRLDAGWLQGLRYAVFGVGDQRYQKYYNVAAKKIDIRLLQLGAVHIIEIGLGDDQDPSGYEKALDPWLMSLWESLNQTNQSLLPRISDIASSNLNNLGEAEIEVTYYSSDNDAPQDSIVSDYKKLIGKASSMHPKFHDDGESQYMLKMVPKQRLTKKESERDVRRFELEDPSSIRAKGGDEVSKGLPMNGLMDRIKLKTFVALTMDVASASPGRYFYEIMSYFATDQLEKETLRDFASPKGRKFFNQYNRKEGQTVLEVLEEFPSVDMPFEWLVQETPPLKKRAFSISSSPLAHSNQIHLTVSVVSWLATPFRRIHGLCSTWLAGLNPNEEILVPCWIHRGSLPPHPSTPLILIGPGTGCAPFRAFVEERAVQSAREPTAPILFFFGCRKEDDDFLYKDFWLHHAQDNKVLSPKEGGGFFVAFSRDQTEKVYVQHKIREQSARVLNMLCSGAAIYVAGSSTQMPADVRAALEEVVREKGGDAEWLRKLERAGKFNIETWS